VRNSERALKRINENRPKINAGKILQEDICGSGINLNKHRGQTENLMR
jgi:hypothetical protein